MGVHELWDIVGPTTRPVRLEALRNKRLAVDASIWIYQFLKAVRDKEGNPLRNSHIVGFFRRICKLLYFGIRPVFVFDGGVPVLKRETIRRRKERREGQRESMEKTAHKLLAKQLQRAAEMKNEGLETVRKPARSSALKSNVPIGKLDLGEYYEDNNYFDGDSMRKTHESEKKEEESRIFRKQDDFDLPQIEEFKIDKKDERMVADYEYDRLTQEIHEDLDNIDLDSIDPISTSFDRLPLSTQYIILSHLRLRSRLRMGYTKDQLEELFSNSMEFSKFQIQRVQKRNYFTQRLMNASGMDTDNKTVSRRRIVGEKDREYTLERTEGGYVLSINKDNEDEGKNVDNAIRLDEEERGRDALEDDDDDDEDIEWEEVPTGTANHSSIMVLDANKSPGNEGARAFMDPSLYNKETLFVDQEEEEENVTGKDDSLMEKIKSLYAYAEENNNKRASMKTMTVATTGNDDEMEGESIEEEDLKQAIESSKKDYMAMLEREKHPKNAGEEEEAKQPPIILSKEALEKTLKLPKFSFGGSLLTQKTKGRDIEEKKDEPLKVVESPTKPVKPLPLPDWFENNAVEDKHRFEPDIGVESLNSLRQETEDEKAGLHKFVEVEDMFSEEDEPEVVVIEDDRKEKKKKKEKQGDEDEGVNVEVVTEMNKGNKEKQEEQEEQEGEPQSSMLPSVPSAQHTDDYEFSEDEEQQLQENIKQEEAAYGTFVNQLSDKKVSSEKKTGSMWSMDEEVKLQEQLRKQKRDSDEVTTNMIMDIQDMLSRFGIPFITAPMEAEAQCAELFKLHLVDGIVTDDSDCFLFGGIKIYKNMFNEKNYVECYQLEDIERDMGLTRTQLIEIAIMLGSDYTDGLKGVGKVTAVEILAEFKSLYKFRDWWLDYQNGVIDKSADDKIKKKLRRQLGKSLYLGEDFPSQQIYQAYLQPEVDHDKTAFKWGYPNLDKLRTFLMYNVGWPQSKVDQILVPIIQNLNKPQQTIEEFFPVELVRKRRQIMMGKRLREATDKLKTRYDAKKRKTEEKK
ncbi:hypothetical protein FOA43_002550 [Brettanomyces nanus]|uniref:Uncharacterized protein n=1 Tax=Eeniella nana TaxID=13502 RepID=A0A875RPL4_EENNA|nr:uncharacterized protein FOA43_002550 [Brettanomyces nanus]QPG75200.1 hypothetical protein FOA43_002550 [Brettanomyces nanus]